MPPRNDALRVIVLLFWMPCLLSGNSSAPSVDGERWRPAWRRRSEDGGCEVRRERSCRRCEWVRVVGTVSGIAVMLLVSGCANEVEVGLNDLLSPVVFLTKTVIISTGSGEAEELRDEETILLCVCVCGVSMSVLRAK
jgi:hypothetical protein